MSEIFFGSGVEKNEKHAMRPPVGEKFNIKAITPPMIAYTATQVSIVVIFTYLTAMISRLALPLAPQLRGVPMMDCFYLMSSTTPFLSCLNILAIHG